MSNQAFKGLAASTGFVRYTLIAGTSAAIVGRSGGQITGVFGELLPDDDYLEFNLDQVFILGTGNFVMRFPQINVPNEDETFYSLELTGEFDTGFDTLELFREDAVYSDPGTNQTGWTWDESFVEKLMIDGNSYRLQLFTEPQVPPGDYIGRFNPGLLPSLIHTMTSAFTPGAIGYGGPGNGTLVPTQMANGRNITRFANFISESSFTIALQGPFIADSDVTFVSVSVTGIFSTGFEPRTLTYIRAERDGYDPDADSGNATRWGWAVDLVSDAFVIGQTYTFDFVYLTDISITGYSDGVGDDSGATPIGSLRPTIWRHPTLGNLEISRLFNTNGDFLFGFNIAGGDDLPDELTTWSELHITGPGGVDYVANKTVGFRSEPLGSYYGWILPSVVGLSNVFEYEVEILTSETEPPTGIIHIDNFNEVLDTSLNSHFPDRGDGVYSDFSVDGALDYGVFAGESMAGRLIAGSGARHAFAATPEISIEGFLEFDFSSTSNSTAGEMGVHLKHDGGPPGSENAYLIAMHHLGPRLDRIINGVRTNLGFGAFTGYVPGQVFRFRLEWHKLDPTGFEFEIFQDGVSDRTWVDTALPEITGPGLVAIGVEAGSTTRGSVKCGNLEYGDFTVPLGPDFLDNFNEVSDTLLTDHVPDIGAAWEIWSLGATGNLLVEGGESRKGRSAGGNVNIRTSEFESSESMYIEYDYLTDVEGGGNTYSVYIRVTDVDEDDAFGYRLNNNGDRISFNRWEQTVQVPLESVFFPDPTRGKIQQIRVEYTNVGDTVNFDVYVDGEFIDTIIDDTPERITEPGRVGARYSFNFDPISEVYKFEYGALGEPAEVLFIEDNFIEASDTLLVDHTPDLGDGPWRSLNQSDQFTVIGGAGHVNKTLSQSVRDCTLEQLEPSENIFVEAVVTYNASDSQVNGFACRWSNNAGDFSSGFRYRVGISFEKLTLDASANGNFTNLGEVIQPFVQTQPYLLRLEVRGINPVTFKVFVDGQLMIEAEDDVFNYPPGRCSVSLSRVSSTIANFRAGLL